MLYKHSLYVEWLIQCFRTFKAEFALPYDIYLPAVCKACCNGTDLIVRNRNIRMHIKICLFRICIPQAGLLILTGNNFLAVCVVYLMIFTMAVASASTV